VVGGGCVGGGGCGGVCAGVCVCVCVCVCVLDADVGLLLVEHICIIYIGSDGCTRCKQQCRHARRSQLIAA